MPITVTVRQGVAAIGGLLAIVGLWVLLWPITVTVDGPFGLPEQLSCGNTLGVVDRPACADSLAAHRAWGWPLLLGGIAVAGAARFVRIVPSAREDV